MISKTSLNIYTLIFLSIYFQSCNLKGPNKNPAFVELQNLIAVKVDSASNHHLRLSDLKITKGEDELRSTEFEGRSAMIMIDGNICTNDDVKWNGLLTEPSGGLPFNIKLELASDPNSEFYRAKNTCAIHNGWASLVKTKDGWDVISVNFFF